MKLVQESGNGTPANETHKDPGPRAGRHLGIRLTTKPGSSRKVHVACVEGDPAAYSRMKEMLASSSPSFCVQHYPTGAEALSAFRSIPPNVVIMNSDLPDIPGTECTIRLKRLVPRLHIVMCSSRGDLHEVFHALASGASGYLLAPVASAELVSAVRKGERGLPFLCKRTQATIVNTLRTAGGTISSETFSKREREVMACLLVESSDKGIAESLHITPKTAHVHVKHLLRKMKVHNRSGAVRRYLGIE